MTSRILLLTATVEPSVDVVRLVRADPAARREDYRRAVAWYASHLSPKRWSIVLVENSGADLGDLRAIASDSGHELLTVAAERDAGGRRGKGNGEARMLDVALLRLAELSPGSTQVVKATGRLVVRNLETAVPAPRGPHITSRVHRDRSMTDTRVLGFDLTTGLAHLTGMHDLVDEAENRYLEHAVALRTAQAVFQGPARWVPFLREPAVAGVSGTDGIAYDTLRSRGTRVAKDLLMRLPHPEYR